MADLDEKSDDGKTVSPADDSTIDLPADKEFAPISGTGSRTNSRSRSRVRSGSMRPSTSRTRSQNGYGCDDNEETTEEEARGAIEKDPYEVHWDNGDEDPLCPRSMSHARKWLVVIIVSASSFCVTCASSMYTPTYTQIEKEFNVSREVATLGLSLFIMGLGIGPMLLGPLSEFYGRRPIYLVSFSMFIIWIIPSAVARNIETMLIARFFDGLSGSAFLSVAGGTVGDMFSRQDLQLPMLIYTGSPFIGPAIGPLIAGFINQYTTWRWTYYVLLIWSGVNLCMIALFVPETYHPVLLRNKARALRNETGDERWKAPMEKTKKSIPRTIAYSLLRPMQLLIFEPMVLNLCLFSAILLGILYLFFGAFGLVFVGNHGFTLSQNGLAFLGIFVGMVLGACTDPFFHKNYERLIKQREEATGEIGGSEPEYRLPPAIAGALLVPAGLFMFAWTTYASVHWILPIIGSTIFGIGLYARAPVAFEMSGVPASRLSASIVLVFMPLSSFESSPTPIQKSDTLLVFSGVFTFLVDAYPLYAASALAANSFARSSFGAAFPLFGVQMYHKLGDQWATSLLAFLTVAMMPFPYLFFKYGKRIRGTSRYASST